MAPLPKEIRVVDLHSEDNWRIYMAVGQNRIYRLSFSYQATRGRFSLTAIALVFKRTDHKTSDLLPPRQQVMLELLHALVHDTETRDEGVFGGRFRVLEKKAFVGP